MIAEIYNNQNELISSLPMSLASDLMKGTLPTYWAKEIEAITSGGYLVIVRYPSYIQRYNNKRYKFLGCFYIDGEAIKVLVRTRFTKKYEVISLNTGNILWSGHDLSLYSKAESGKRL